MASVQMSQTLRDQILKNYEKKLKVTLREIHNVQPAIDFIIDSFKNDDEDFQKLLELNETYIPLAVTLEGRYPTGNQYSKNYDECIIKTQTEMGIICNTNRPISDNLTFVKNWAAPYNTTSYEGDTETVSGEEYVEGDIGVSLKDIDPFYLPDRTSLRYDNWRASGYSPCADCAVIVTDPGLCEQLSPIGSIEQEVATKVEDFKSWLETVTTLKKFLDAVSGGLDFVPEEYKQRLLKKATPRKPTVAPPVDIMPDALKNTLNEVILESKLLGDD